MPEVFKILKSCVFIDIKELMSKDHKSKMTSKSIPGEYVSMICTKNNKQLKLCITLQG